MTPLAQQIAESRKTCPCGYVGYDWEFAQDFRYKGDPWLCPKCQGKGLTDRDREEMPRSGTMFTEIELGVNTEGADG